MDHVYSLLQQQEEKMNNTLEVNVENDAEHTLDLVQSNCTLFVHCQTLCLSQRLVTCLAYFHYALDEHQFQ
jgi:hypothetical protein